jgi:hypothetical protein
MAPGTQKEYEDLMPSAPADGSKMAVLLFKQEHGPDPALANTTPRVGATLVRPLDENAAAVGQARAERRFAWLLLITLPGP